MQQMTNTTQMVNKVKRPLGIIVVALLMLAFGLMEVVTAFTHHFFGISTSTALMFTYRQPPSVHSCNWRVTDTDHEEMGISIRDYITHCRHYRANRTRYGRPLPDRFFRADICHCHGHGHSGYLCALHRMEVEIIQVISLILLQPW